VTEVHEVRPIVIRKGMFEKSDCPNDNTKSIIIKRGLSSPIIFLTQRIIAYIYVLAAILKDSFRFNDCFIIRQINLTLQRELN